MSGQAPCSSERCKTCNPPSREVLVGLSFVKPGDRRKPVSVVLTIQDEVANAVRTIEFDEHEFALFLSGSVIQKTEEVS